MDPTRKKAEVNGKARLRKALIILFWLLVWEAADRIIDNRLVLSGPVRVLQALMVQIRKEEFWQICGASFGRIVLGFLLSFVVGALLAVLAFPRPVFSHDADGSSGRGDPSGRSISRGYTLLCSLR
ncbi:MAG: hypothetical protein IJ133_05630 [Clostridia bacterium]|nr:hypothetical protein [Clostridia bacterium]